MRGKKIFGFSSCVFGWRVEKWDDEFFFFFLFGWREKWEDGKYGRK